MPRPPLDLTVYLVTDTDLCTDRGVAATVREAVAAGATTVQLRDPACSDQAFLRLGRQVRDVLPPGVPLLVNDRVHLVDAIRADGAHVGQKDMPPVEARARLGPHRYLGLSAQTQEHVAAARGLPNGTIDYLGVGPVWPQTTKPDAAAPSGTQLLASLIRASPWPCVAIGGIDAARAVLARRAGACGVAVVSAICGQPDVAAATRSLKEAWEETR
jgi:thiamine-phosphate pyrophosphorylase